MAATRKKRSVTKGKTRKAPTESATSLPEGTIKAGYVIKKASNGVPRWVPSVSAELNGFRFLTVDYVMKHLGKPITLYAREYSDVWPKKNAWSKNADATHYIVKFTPNGDAIREKTRLSGWLRTQKPEITKGSHFSIDGPVYQCSSGKCQDHLFDGVQVDANGKKLMSFNFFTTDVFVKV